MELPTQIIDGYWIFHGNLNFISLDVGKWMLFYHKSKLDNKWLEICNLFDNNKLLGVDFLKCSTSLYNPRSSDNNYGVIILYCSDSQNKEKIINIGNNIILYIQDYTNEYIYYKTDKQTTNRTYATGSKVNYLYKLYISKDLFLD